MNILILTTHFNTGGITSYCLNLSRGLMRLNHRVIVVSSGGECVERLKYYGAQHVTLDIHVKSEAHPKVFAAINPLIKIIEEERVDIIHAQTRVTQVLASIVSARTKRPFVSTCHGFFKTRFFRRIYPCWGRGTIAISQGVKEHLEKDFKLQTGQVALIPNGIDDSQFIDNDENRRLQKYREWKATEGPNIGIIARLSSVKSIDILVMAFIHVLEKYPAAVLWIVGDGPERNNLHALVLKHKLTKSVRFVPQVHHPAQILHIFNVFVMPSSQEGLGLSVIEAQAAGIPVVVSNVGGLKEVVSDGQTGLVVEPNNAYLLAARIIESLDDPQRAKQMANAAQNHVKTHYSLEKMVDSTVEFYEQYISR